MSEALAMDKPTDTPAAPRADNLSPIIRATNLHKTYLMGSAWIKVLTGASISVSPGEFVAIMGASGSGKSTLLHILGALDLPDRGQVHFENVDVFSGGARLRNRLRTCF